MSGDPWDLDPLDTDAVALAWSDTHALPVDPPAHLTESADRFVLGAELGRGAMGVVTLAEDRDLDRTVAIKQLAPELASRPGHVEAFIQEARLTGSLGHPNIVPVYELGQRADGQPFFAMRRLRGRPLGAVVRLLRQGDEAVVGAFSRTRLLTVFLQICGAVEFAHSRGVIHRDLKPDNIVVGDYGDVQLLDWGIAARVEDVDAPATGDLRAAAGTPGYLAPELLDREALVVPRRLDVYALGAILYELLTLRRPVLGGSAQELLTATTNGDFVAPSVRAPERNVPVELDGICLAALDHNPASRTASAARLALEVEEFLEGSREARRRADAADQATLAAVTILAAHDGLGDDLDEARAEVLRFHDQLAPWDRIEAKRPMWRAEDRVRELVAQRAEAVEEAEARYRHALEEVNDHLDATSGLLELWMGRLRADEEIGDSLAVRRTAARIRALDPDGADDRLRGDGRLTLVSEPAGARAWLHAFDERDRLLLPADGTDLGRTPLVDVVVPRGRHLVLLEATGREAARVPLWIPRDGRAEHHVVLRDHGEIPEGMVYVPAGEFLTGGEDARYGGRRPLRTASTDAFAIANGPVTMREYAGFMDSLLDRGPAGADVRCPRSDRGEPLMVLGSDIRFRPASGPLVPADGDPFTTRAARRLPVVGVSWDDAVAFAAYRSAQLGVELTLPTTAQWEKAARGVDGRPYPWGDTWDPGFSNRAGSRPGAPRLEPVGTYGMDQSVYGMRDACGGVQEWCADAVGEERRACRGGDWTEASGRTLGATLSAHASSRSLSVGFRLVTNFRSASPPPGS